MSAAATALEALLAATPEPPDGAEPGDVVDAGADMVEARRPHIERLRSAVAGGAVLAGAATGMLAELRERDAAWTRALELAHRELARRIAGVRRLRQRRR